MTASCWDAGTAARAAGADAAGSAMANAGAPSVNASAPTAATAPTLCRCFIDFPRL